MALSKLTTVLNTISTMDTVIRDQASNVKADLEHDVNVVKDFINNTLTSEIDTLNDGNVKLAGEQLIEGVKTFGQGLYVPAPTEDMQPTTKKYVDDKANVHKESADHDSRYFTETELGSIVDSDSGADKIGVTPIPTLAGENAQAVLESIKGRLDNIGETNTNVELSNSHYGANGQTYASVGARCDSIDAELVEVNGTLAQKASQAALNATNAEVGLKANQSSLNETNATVSLKADKSEVTNVMTPKGNIAYASLPTTGNTVGWYYYCSDGDGTNGKGNYVWNGTAWYYGGTGDEGYNKLKADISDKGNNPTFKSGKWININGIASTGGTIDLYTDFISVKKGNTIATNIGGTINTNVISMYSQANESTFIEGVVNAYNTFEKTYNVTQDGYVVFYANTAVIGTNDIYVRVFNNNENYILSANSDNISHSITTNLRYSEDDTINKFIKQGIIEGEYQHIKINVIGNKFTDFGAEEYYINAVDDNGNAYNYYVQNTTPNDSITIISGNTTLKLYVDWSAIPVGRNEYGKYLTLKLYKNTAYDLELRTEVDDLKTKVETQYDGGLSKYSTMYRYLCLTFSNLDQGLYLLGSNDAFTNSYLIKNNIYTPALGRKTLRDPSWMYYKGYYYIVYNVEATKENPLISDTDFDEIGIVRTKDFVTFYEYPHIHLSNVDITFINAIWAPAFCVINDKCYILTWAQPEGMSSGSYLFEYNPKTNNVVFIQKMNGFLLDTHIYFINNKYYAIGNNDGEIGIKIMESDTLLGNYTTKKTIGTDNYYEGAYLVALDNNTWRIFVWKNLNNKMCYCDSLTNDLTGVWTDLVENIRHDYAFDEEHYTVIDMLNVEANTLN